MIRVYPLVVLLAGLTTVAGASVASACPPGTRVISHVVEVRPVETVVVARVEPPPVVRQVVVSTVQPSAAGSTEAKAVPNTPPTPQKVSVGAHLALKLHFAGTEPGEVLVRVHELVLRTRVINWGRDMVTFRLPAELDPVNSSALPATIEAYGADGRLLRKIGVVITTPPELSEVVEAPLAIATTEPAPAN